MTFVPSDYSYAGEESASSKAALASQGIQVGSQLLSTFFTGRTEKQLEQSRLSHEAATMEGRTELTAMQAQIEAERAKRDASAAYIAGLGTKRTLVMVGGAVLMLGMIMAAVVAIKRGN